MGDSMMSSKDSRKDKTRRGMSSSKLSKDGRCLSAPLLPASQSTHTSTWYTASTMTGGTSSNRSLWKPLAGSWRNWDSDEFGPVRKNVDEGRAFLDGCIPHYGKGNSVRKNHSLEHELAYAYYRTRRHLLHPHRKEVGDPTLPQDNVVAQMRSGLDKQFFFWRDLRPPFTVVEVTRMPSAPTGQHPDGDVHEVIYECAIDYHGEHLWNTKSNNGTFDNKIHGVALVRIPDGYPRKRPISLLNWGTPMLNWDPSMDVDNDGNPLRPVRIDPMKWMSIADELQVRADHPRFAETRSCINKVDRLHGFTQAKPLQKLLMRPNTSLSQLAKKAELEYQTATDDFPLKQVKPRTHRIFTAAAGFVKYAG